MLQDYLQAYVNKYGFSGYTELRAQQNRNRGVMMLNGSLTANNSGISRGLSARVVKGGAYGFASGTGYNDDIEAIARVVQTASSHAAFLDSRVRRGKPDFPANAAFVRKDGFEQDVPVEQGYLLGIVDEFDSVHRRAFSQTAQPAGLRPRARHGKAALYQRRSYFSLVRASFKRLRFHDHPGQGRSARGTL